MTTVECAGVYLEQRHGQLASWIHTHRTVCNGLQRLVREEHIMKGSGPMNRRLAEAVIATFREADRDTHVQQLACLEDRDWRRGLHWLDSSGLALYFGHRIKSSGLEECVPPETLEALDQRLADNKQRTAELFREFEAINNAFQKAGVRYVNLKGFTLVPDYCPDPSLRCQFDLDFMISSSDLSLCQSILESFGYGVTGKHRNVVELKADSAQVPSIRDLYRPRRQRSVEVHFVPAPPAAPGSDNGLLSRLQNRAWNGVSFPALSDVDMFLAQANHLFRHLKSEWTRISWLLEFRTFVNARREDTQFWQNVRNQIATDDESALAVGTAVLLATEAFGEFGPPELLEWSTDAVPRSVRVWLDRYGKTVLVSDFPGTKLYLLLERELSSDGNARTISWGRLFPLHRPPRIAYPKGQGSLRRMRASLSQLWFALFRLRFHVLEGSRYLIAAQQWKRRVDGQAG